MHKYSAWLLIQNIYWRSLLIFLRQIKSCSIHTCLFSRVHHIRLYENSPNYSPFRSFWFFFQTIYWANNQKLDIALSRVLWKKENVRAVFFHTWLLFLTRFKSCHWNCWGRILKVSFLHKSNQSRLPKQYLDFGAGCEAWYSSPLPPPSGAFIKKSAKIEKQVKCSPPVPLFREKSFKIFLRNALNMELDYTY